MENISRKKFLKTGVAALAGSSLLATACGSEGNILPRVPPTFKQEKNIVGNGDYLAT